jgi:TetR/AcrR family transcriptional repressor of nem operon
MRGSDHFISSRWVIMALATFANYKTKEDKMARARKVEIGTARALALSAFWSHGYQSLGVRKLEELTGINRFMLQTEFGGKQGLFLETIDSYISQWDENYLIQIRAGNIDQIVHFFNLRASNATAPEANNGCLMINTLCEGQVEDSEIKDRVFKFMRLMRSSLRLALCNERSQGSLKKSVDIDEASEMLANALIGMNVTIKLHGKNEAAQAAAKQLCKTVLSWRKKS